MTTDDQGNEIGKLFVGGLHQSTNNDKLKSYFSKYGDVEEASVMMDNKTRRSRGFGYVKFVDGDIVNKVMSLNKHILDGKEIDPKPCNVNMKGKSRRSLKVFVGGIAPEHNEETLREYFKQYGTITELTLMKDPSGHRHRGFAFVGYDDEEVVKQLINDHYLTIGSKQVEIKQMEPQAGRNNNNNSCNSMDMSMGMGITAMKRNINMGPMQATASAASSQWSTPQWSGNPATPWSTNHTASGVISAANQVSSNHPWPTASHQTNPNNHHHHHHHQLWTAAADWATAAALNSCGWPTTTPGGGGGGGGGGNTPPNQHQTQAAHNIHNNGANRHTTELLQQHTQGANPHQSWDHPQHSLWGPPPHHHHPHPHHHQGQPPPPPPPPSVTPGNQWPHQPGTMGTSGATAAPGNAATSWDPLNMHPQHHHQHQHHQHQQQQQQWINQQHPGTDWRALNGTFANTSGPQPQQFKRC